MREKLKKYLDKCLGAYASDVRTVKVDNATNTILKLISESLPKYKKPDNGYPSLSVYQYNQALADVRERLGV